MLSPAMQEPSPMGCSIVVLDLPEMGVVSVLFPGASDTSSLLEIEEAIGRVAKEMM
jgi:hypothetical protein